MGSFDDVDEIYEDDNFSLCLYSSEIGKKYALVIDDHEYYLDKRKARKIVKKLQETFHI